MGRQLTSESAIQKKLVDGLAAQGWWVQKVVGQSRNGLPDLVAIHNGETLWIEVKRDNGKLSRFQTLEIANMTMNGAKVLVIFGMAEAADFLDNDADTVFDDMRKAKKLVCSYRKLFPEVDDNE